MFKGLSNLTGLLQQVQQFQGRTEELQQKLGQMRVEGRAGGEMVSVQADGRQRIVGIKIDPSLLTSPDAEMLEDLLTAATNQALDKSRELMAEEFAKMSQVQLPGLSELMSKFGMGFSSHSSNVADATRRAGRRQMTPCYVCYVMLRSNTEFIYSCFVMQVLVNKLVADDTVRRQKYHVTTRYFALHRVWHLLGLRP